MPKISGIQHPPDIRLEIRYPDFKMAGYLTKLLSGPSLISSHVCTLEVMSISNMHITYMIYWIWFNFHVYFGFQGRHDILYTYKRVKSLWKPGYT